VNIGLSDHTLGYLAPVIATSLGAKVIEKHFILNHSIGGPDASFSMDENEFKEMVDAVRSTEKALGNSSYELTSKQKEGKVFSRSLYPTCDIQMGELITTNNIRSVRPGHSLQPIFLNEIIGKKAKRNISFGERISLDDFE
jgi:pseudaminic acid synthase